jgi:hypothetical protein
MTSPQRNLFKYYFPQIENFKTLMYLAHSMLQKKAKPLKIMSPIC